MQLAYVEHAWTSSHFTVVALVRLLLDRANGEAGRLVRQMASRAGLTA